MYSRMEASVKMLVYVVNIFTMFVGPDSWGEVTEAGLEEAIFVYLLKKRKKLLSYCGIVHLVHIFCCSILSLVEILFAFVLKHGNNNYMLMNLMNLKGSRI